MTDEHPAYKSLEERGYNHHNVNHGEGEYASGEHNEIHTNNCKCRIGLLKWWLRGRAAAFYCRVRCASLEYEVIRLALAGLALAPAAICDARSRSVPVWWLGVGWAAACMFTIYGVVWGGMGWWPGGAAAALGVLCGGLLVAASRHVMLGAADGHIMAVSCMMLPWHGGVPTALCGIAAGCAAALAWMIALNVWYNLRDMAGGRAVPLRDLFTCHRKRPGERFAVGVARRGPVHMGDSGTVRDTAGDLFEPARAEGGRVRPVAPMALFVVSGVLAVSAYVAVLAPIFG